MKSVLRLFHLTTRNNGMVRGKVGRNNSVVGRGFFWDVFLALIEQMNNKTGN